MEKKTFVKKELIQELQSKYPKILKINIDFNDGGLWPWEVNSSKFISSPYDNKKASITERELK